MQPEQVLYELKILRKRRQIKTKGIDHEATWQIYPRSRAEEAHAC
jgi:hypothetical protein